MTDQRVHDTFVELTEMLVGGRDIGGYFERLAARCVELLDISAAGLMVVDEQSGHTRLAASCPAADRFQQLELAHTEGPDIDCIRTSEPIGQLELDSAHELWPTVAPTAGELGFVSVYAVPLRLRDSCVGALSLFVDHAEPLDEQRLELAQALANSASLGLGLQRARRSEHLAGQLQVALHSRVAIEQAKGILAERLNISVDEAFGEMRHYARSNGRRLVDIAGAVTDGSLSLPDRPHR